MSEGAKRNDENVSGAAPRRPHNSPAEGRVGRGVVLADLVVGAGGHLRGDEDTLGRGDHVVAGRRKVARRKGMDAVGG